MKKIFIGLFLAGFLGFSPLARATLWDRGGGLIYDDDLNITWLQDPYYAGKELTSQRINEIIATVGSIGDHTLTAADFSSEYSERMTWWGAMAWASWPAPGFCTSF
jgi:hypothetical protein